MVIGSTRPLIRDSCCRYLISLMKDDEYSLFAVEDKVKDQLDAANPEPIIEEVVSSPFCVDVIYYVEEASWFRLPYSAVFLPQDLANLAPRKPDWYDVFENYLTTRMAHNILARFKICFPHCLFFVTLNLGI